MAYNKPIPVREAGDSEPIQEQEEGIGLYTGGKINSSDVM